MAESTRKWFELLNAFFAPLRQAGGSDSSAADSAEEQRWLAEQRLKAHLAEYDGHKRELLTQIELYSRQTQYVQIYAVVVGSVVAIVVGRVPNLGGLQLDESTIGILLLLGAAIAFLLAAATLAPTYMFFVLRGRLRKLESEISDLLKAPELMTYERSVVSHFLGRSTYARTALTPHVIFGGWRIATLGLVLLMLAAVAFAKTRATFAAPYAAVLFVCACWHLHAHFSLYVGAGRQAIDAFYEGRTPDRGSAWYAASNVILSLVFAVLVGFGAAHWETIVSYSLAVADPGNLNCGQPLRLLLGAAAAYNYLCGTVLPLLSEAPLMLYPCLSTAGLASLIAASALGKAFGAMSLHAFRDAAWRLLRRTKLGEAIVLPARMHGFLQRHGFKAFIALQAVPFFPMRSSVLAYSALGGSAMRIGVGAALGTVSRNLILLALAWMGIASLRAMLQS